jgi:hypothetical protein
MRQKSRLVLPCDPEYTGHREAEKRRQETREWLLQRGRASSARSIVPDVPDASEAPKGNLHVERRRSYSRR